MLRLGIIPLASLLALVHLASGTAAQGRARPFVHHELIVQYEQGTDEHARARARGRARAQLARLHHAGRGTAGEAPMEVITLPAGQQLDAAIRLMQDDPAVAYAEVNWVYTHFAAPNDPYLGQLWGLNNTGQVIAGRAAGTPDADIDGLEAWASTTGSPQVYVAVLDEGIHTAHQDLGTDGGPIWTNPYDPVDGIDNDRNGYVDDRHGFDFAANDTSVYDGSSADVSIDAHGTHLAGTIGARANNGIGVAGVNWDVRIIPAKFLTTAGGTTDAAVRAIDYVVDLKARHGLNIVAINASWGGGGFSQALLDAISRAARAEILFIAAAGNGGADAQGDSNDLVPDYPASYDTTGTAGYDSVISVAATGLSDELAAFSNYGERSVDLGAPGVYILSTTPQNGYRYSSGTSMAAPHVTGAAALISAATAATGRDLRARLLSAVDPVAALRGRTVTGGRLNLGAALPVTQSTPPATEPAPATPASLPEPWRSEDIGAVGVAGAASASGGTFAVTGGGADVWGTADALRFAYQPLTGDGTVVARVASVQNVHAWTKAGVMIRASLSASSAHAFMLVSPGKGTAFQRRASDGGVSASTPGTFTTAPRWVKLTRAGTTISASESADGARWNHVGSASITLGQTAYVGLVVSSHVAGTLAEARFDSVSVSPAAATTAPAPTPPVVSWANGDVGAVGRAGSAGQSNGTFTVSGSGADIWGTADQFHYVYQPLTGDATIVARVASIQNTHAWVKAGVMIRETLAADSPQALMLVTPAGTKGLAFQRRVSAGGLSTSTAGGAGTPPAWVKLVRAGSTITAYRSADGATWTLVGSDTFAMGAAVHVGLAVSSHDNTVLSTAVFDQVSITR